MKSRRPQKADPGHFGSGFARALSKLGFCSRSKACNLIAAGRARVNGIVRRDPEWRVDLNHDQLEVDGETVHAEQKVYLILNKPRGLVTTVADERGRETVFVCLAGKDLPSVMPVGRLDKASEGLLLFTNDTWFAAQITDPRSRVEKTYHVQVNHVVDEALCQRIRQGAVCDGEQLSAVKVGVLRTGEKNSWLEIVLDEGKNRHIRRLLAAFDIDVLRLVRVAIGPLMLGSLPKGEIRLLEPHEVVTLRNSATH